MINLKKFLIFIGCLIIALGYSFAIYMAAYKAGYCQGRLDSIIVYKINTNKRL